MKLRKYLRYLVTLTLFITTTACSSTPNSKAEAVEPEASAQEFFLKGNDLLNERKWKEAIAEYDQGLAVEPNRADLHVNRAIAFMQTGDFEEALAGIDRALESGINDPMLLFNLGNIYQERGLYDQALVAYRASLAQGNPDDQETLVNIAASYLFQRQFPEAEATYRHIRSLYPDDPRALHGLALSEHMQSRFEEALAGYEQLLNLFPNYTHGVFMRAHVLHHLGRNEEALAEFQRYLTLNDITYKIHAETMVGAITRILERERR